jgi:hypothetical protein
MNGELSLGGEPIGDAAELMLLPESCERENLFRRIRREGLLGLLTI